MKHLSYSEKFILHVALPHAEAQRKLVSITDIGYKADVNVSQNAPALTELTIEVNGLQKFNKLNSIIQDY